MLARSLLFLYYCGAFSARPYHSLEDFLKMLTVLILCLVVPLITMTTTVNSSTTNRDHFKPWCDNSPNTNIWCYANTSGFNTEDSCLEIWDTVFGNVNRKVAESCNSSDGIFKVRVYLDQIGASDFDIRLTNGSEFTAVRLELREKVMPEPPINIDVVRVDNQSFNVSYEYPDSWILSKTIYQCERYIPYLGKSANVSTKDGVYDRQKRKVITVELKEIPQLPQLPGHTEVCFRCRFRYGYYYTIFSPYSLLGCNFTSTQAPSGPPLNLTILERKDPRRVTLKWEPPSKQYRNGIITGYMILLKPSQGNSTIDEITDIRGTKRTIELEDPHEDYEIRLYASTSAGFSADYASIPVMGIDPPNIVVFVATGIVGFLSLLILLRVIYILRRKMQSRHLPEPYLIPEARMIQFLARKGFLPKQEKEVFDTLKTDGEFSSSESKSETQGNSRGAKSDSGILTDCEDKHSVGGVSVYSLRIEKEKPVNDFMEVDYVNDLKYENVQKTSEMYNLETTTHVEHQQENGYNNTGALSIEGNCERESNTGRAYYNL